MCCLTWLRVAEYSGLTGRKGTALRSVTSVLWFWVVSQTGGKKKIQKPKSIYLSVVACSDMFHIGSISTYTCRHTGSPKHVSTLKIGSWIPLIWFNVCFCVQLLTKEIELAQITSLFLTLSIKINSDTNFFSLQLIAFYSIILLLILFSSIIKGGSVLSFDVALNMMVMRQNEAHLHHFLCGLPRHKRPLPVPQTADCWAAKHKQTSSKKLIYTSVF